MQLKLLQMITWPAYNKLSLAQICLHLLRRLVSHSMTQRKPPSTSGIKTGSAFSALLMLCAKAAQNVGFEEVCCELGHVRLQDRKDNRSTQGEYNVLVGKGTCFTR